jgi:hypothetical protein
MVIVGAGVKPILPVRTEFFKPGQLAPICGNVNHADFLNPVWTYVLTGESE